MSDNIICRTVNSKIIHRWHGLPKRGALCSCGRSRWASGLKKWEPPRDPRVNREVKP